MPLSSTYTTGTITVAANGTAVTGAGTNWLAGGVRPGDILAVRGLTITIASVTNANTLILATTWPGGALSGSRYEIRYTPDATRVLASSREAIAALESARSDIYISANVYASPAAGLAATTSGQQFQTISVNGENVVRYRHDPGGVATEVARYPTASAVNAAVAQATSAATTAADGVRAQVKADADRAAAALAAAQTIVSTISLAVVRQRDDGTWPPRPDALVVHFLGWDDPRALMKPDDLWFSPQEYPTAPPQIDSATWRAYNAMDGQNLVLRLLQAPVVQRPAILGYQYQLTYTDANGAQVVTAPGALPMTVGDTFLAVPAGARVYGVEIRARNYLGAGPWSAVKAVTVSDQPFADNFDRTVNQRVEAAGNWTRHVGNTAHGLLIGTGGVAQNSSTARNETVLADIYVPDNQYVEARILSSHALDFRNNDGVALLARVQEGAVGGYSLKIGPGTFDLRRGMSGGNNADRIATGAFPTGAVLPVTARLTAVGTTLTVTINGEVVWTGTDTQFTSGRVGLQMRSPTAPLASADDFRAGPAT